MIKENAYAMKKKKNKGCFRIACFRPVEAPVGWTATFGVSMRRILPSTNKDYRAAFRRNTGVFVRFAHSRR